MPCQATIYGCVEKGMFYSAHTIFVKTGSTGKLLQGEVSIVDQQHDLMNHEKCTCSEHGFQHIQWNPYTPDTIRTTVSVLISGVSLFQGLI